MTGAWLAGTALAVVVTGAVACLAIRAAAEIGDAIDRFGDDFASDPRPASLLSALSHPSGHSDESQHDHA